MRWFRSWLRGVMDPEPPRPVFRAPTFPIVLWDDEPPTDKTQVMVHEDASTDSGVVPQAAFAPPAVGPPRDRRGRQGHKLRLVVVRVSLVEWVRLGKQAQAGEDMGDVLRRWADLPPLRR